MKKKISAFGFVFNDNNEVLLCYIPAKGKWNLPGGKVNNNESPQEGLERELVEEIGCKVEKVHFTSNYYIRLKDKIVFYYLVSIGGQTPVACQEVSRVNFFPVNSLSSQDLPYCQQFLHDASEFFSSSDFNQSKLISKSRWMKRSRIRAIQAVKMMLGKLLRVFQGK